MFGKVNMTIDSSIVIQDHMRFPAHLPADDTERKGSVGRAAGAVAGPGLGLGPRLPKSLGPSCWTKEAAKPRLRIHACPFTCWAKMASLSLATKAIHGSEVAVKRAIDLGIGCSFLSISAADCEQSTSVEDHQSLSSHVCT